MGGKIREKVQEVSRGQVTKTLLCQRNYLNRVLEVVKDLTYVSAINRIVLLDDDS